MGNSEIILVIIMALGFAMVLSKLNTAIRYISLSVSILAGNMIAESLDGETAILREKESDDE